MPVGPGVSSSARLHQTGREAPVQRPACAPKRTIQPSTGREAWMDGWMEGGEKGLGGVKSRGGGDGGRGGGGEGVLPPAVSFATSQPKAS